MAMNIRKSGLGAALMLAMGFLAQTAASEELSVATFVPPQHHTNTGMFAWFAEEIDRRSGGTLTMKLYPAGQLGAGPVQQYKRAVEGVADITFGVSAYTPALNCTFVLLDWARTQLTGRVEFHRQCPAGALVDFFCEPCEHTGVGVVLWRQKRCNAELFATGCLC